VLQRYHFSSHLRRMAAIVAIEEEDATQPVPVAVMKGAPEVVRQHLGQVSRPRPDQPCDVQQQLSSWSSWSNLDGCKYKTGIDYGSCLSTGRQN
jgi:magnesium-transporting ATPase (P-type)